MSRLPRFVAFASVVVLLGLSVAVGVPASASADIVPPVLPPNGIGLGPEVQYMLSVRGAALFESQSAASKAAWSPQLGRDGALTANEYRAHLTYGNVNPDNLAEVVPINGDGFTVPRTPMTSLKNFVKPTVGGVVVGTVAATAFEQRADIANGVLSWFGQDANAAVCSDSVSGGHNFVNFLTGQNCDAWHAAHDYVPNTDAAGSVAGAVACSLAGVCFQLTSVGENVYQPYSQVATVACFALSGVATATGSYLVDGGSVPYFFRAAGPSTGSIGKLPLAARYATGACGGSGGLSYLGGGNLAPSDSFGPAGFTSYGWGHRDVSGGVVLDTAAQPVTVASTDPDRTLQCVLTYSDGTTEQGSTASFKESAGSWPTPNCPQPGSKIVTHMKVTELGGDQANVMYDEAMNADYVAHAAGDKTMCGTSACILDLKDLTTGRSCFAESALCDGWMADPARDTKYKCTYGSQTDPIQDCYVYANVFNAAKRLAGDAYADPHTGDDVGGFGSTSESADSRLMGRAPGVGPSFSWSSCFGGTYSAFNPLEWTLKPMQCALQWAFSPNPVVVQSAMIQLQSTWSNTAPAKFATAVSSWHVAPVMTGCRSDMAFPMPFFGKTVTVPIIDTCPGTALGSMAGFIRAVGDVALGVTVGFAIKRRIAGWVDYS